MSKNATLKRIIHSTHTFGFNVSFSQIVVVKFLGIKIEQEKRIDNHSSLRNSWETNNL